MNRKALPFVLGGIGVGLAWFLIRRENPTQRLNRALVALTRYRAQVAARAPTSDLQIRAREAELKRIDARLDALRRALMDLGAGSGRTERLPGRV